MDIHLKNIAKEFDGFRALHDVSLDIRSAEQQDEDEAGNHR